MLSFSALLRKLCFFWLDNFKLDMESAQGVVLVETKVVQLDLCLNCKLCVYSVNSPTKIDEIVQSCEGNVATWINKWPKNMILIDFFIAAN